MAEIDSLPIVREGIWLYAKAVPVRVRVLSSPETWGTGDYEDEPETADNQPIACLFLVYEAAGSPGAFCNVVPNLVTVEAAVALAEERFPGIKWLDVMTTHPSRSKKTRGSKT